MKSMMNKFGYSYHFLSVVSPCLTGASDCHENAECRDIAHGSYSCHCRQGYEGDGVNCTGKNITYWAAILKVSLYSVCITIYVIDVITQA